MSIVVIGTMAFDSIETPFGKEDKILGGSANFFAMAASAFTDVKAVSIVGQDFPEDHMQLLKSRNVDTEGVVKAEGNTFHWTGKYGYDLNEAHTLATDLNVLADFDPVLPESYANAPFVFLGNLMPSLQMKVLDQVKNPKFTALDTMNFWIEGAKDELISAIKRVNAVIINEAEARQLTEEYNLVKVYETIRGWGPQIVVIKQGEYGALLFDHGKAFSVPGLILDEVKDPTGAGDSFAGGFMGYLASQKGFSTSAEELRKAVVYGCATASFTVQDFSFRELVKLNREKLDERYRRFVDLTRFELSK